jgi:hypothetical protein
VNSQTTTYTEHLTDTLVYKATKRYDTSHFVRAIETEFGRYIATNDFMHGAEDGDIAQGTIKRTTART